ncbi:hypothetical protein DINM_006192 [Dirofilaria immitis]|nr:hypothetical protein [Dirofilaria immitis]
METPANQVIKILDSLKCRNSNCTIQQELIKEIKQGHVKRNTFLDYSELFEGEEEELIALVPEGGFLSNRLFKLSDWDMLKVAKFISRNFRRSCDQPIEN